MLDAVIFAKGWQEIFCQRGC